MIFTLIPYITIEYKSIQNKHIFYFEALSKENEMVKYILSGYSGSIAKELYISLATVKTHISNIYRKLNINSKQELFELMKKN